MDSNIAELADLDNGLSANDRILSEVASAHESQYPLGSPSQCYQQHDVGGRSELHGNDYGAVNNQSSDLANEENVNAGRQCCRSADYSESQEPLSPASIKLGHCFVSKQPKTSNNGIKVATIMY